MAVGAWPWSRQKSRAHGKATENWIAFEILSAVRLPWWVDVLALWNVVLLSNLVQGCSCSKCSQLCTVHIQKLEFIVFGHQPQRFSSFVGETSNYVKWVLLYGQLISQNLNNFVFSQFCPLIVEFVWSLETFTFNLQDWNVSVLLHILLWLHSFL